MIQYKHGKLEVTPRDPVGRQFIVAPWESMLSSSFHKHRKARLYIPLYVLFSPFIHPSLFFQRHRAMENTTTRFSEVKQEEPSMTAKTTSSPAPCTPQATSASASGDGAEASEDGVDDIEVVEMEHLFSKVLMPSDVGKVVDRFVIPADHVGKLDAVAKDQDGFNVLILEDCVVAGRLWCFRYSYWSGSRIHYLTKGWGLFVKKKGLHAGDTVSFFRGARGTARGRLFVNCRRCVDARAPRTVPATMSRHGFFALPAAATLYNGYRVHQRPNGPGTSNAAGAATRHGFLEGMHARVPPVQPPRRPRRVRVHPDPVVTIGMPSILESMPLIHRPAAKRVRLFGVYLDEPLPDSGKPSNDTGTWSLGMPFWQKH